MNEICLSTGRAAASGNAKPVHRQVEQNHVVKRRISVPGAVAPGPIEKEVK